MNRTVKVICGKCGVRGLGLGVLRKVDGDLRPSEDGKWLFMLKMVCRPGGRPMDLRRVGPDRRVAWATGDPTKCTMDAEGDHYSFTCHPKCGASYYLRNDTITSLALGVLNSGGDRLVLGSQHLRRSPKR